MNIESLIGVGDIIDKWSIVKLKAERIQHEESKREFEVYNNVLEGIKEKYPQYDWDLICKMMLKINDYIWQFEAGTKSAKETLPNPQYLLDKANEEILIKAGVIHFEIKNFNSIRVDMRNLINFLTNTGFRDIKKEHLSE